MLAWSVRAARSEQSLIIPHTTAAKCSAMPAVATPPAQVCIVHNRHKSKSFCVYTGKAGELAGHAVGITT